MTEKIQNFCKQEVTSCVFTENFKKLLRQYTFCLTTFQVALLTQTWPKKSKSVLRFEISWWEGGQKIDQTHRQTWNP